MVLDSNTVQIPIKSKEEYFSFNTNKLIWLYQLKLYSVPQNSRGRIKLINVQRMYEMTPHYLVLV